MFGCGNGTETHNHIVHETAEIDSPINKPQPTIVIPRHFSRDSIFNRLQAKKDNKELRIIHVLVPLCDNDNQGIVPVNKSLGDGLNLRTNLYWGAGYGIKTHFTRSSTWVTKSSTLNPQKAILERVVFKHKTENIILIADAYRGDSMRACVTNYFKEIAGLVEDSIKVDSTWIPFGKQTDLVAFNGHNGLMDLNIDPIRSVDGKVKDAVAIACASHTFFAPKLNRSGGYPLLLTTNLLAPEAYVLHNVLDKWVENKTADEIRLAAGQGYHDVQKCGLRGATNLFITGWGE